MQSPVPIDQLVVSNSSEEDFIKNLELSPDGCSLILALESARILVFQLATHLIEENLYFPQLAFDEYFQRNNHSTFIQESCRIDCGESIFDSKWNPTMNLLNPSSCYFVTTSRDHPIHLWDSLSGKLVCSYSGFNQFDELDPAISLAFAPEGDKIISGSKGKLRIFDISYPGRNYHEISTGNGSGHGQSGILSSIVFRADQPKYFAVGSYSNSLGVYSLDHDESLMVFPDLRIGGITHMKWALDGNSIWVSGRKTDEIVCLDVRYNRGIVGSVERSLSTNQKFKFDIDPWGKYLITGSQRNELMIFDTTTFALVDRLETENCDGINSVSFHPFSRMLVTANGQRHFERTQHKIGCQLHCDESPEERGNAPNLEYASGVQFWKLDSTQFNPV